MSEVHVSGLNLRPAGLLTQFGVGLQTRCVFLVSGINHSPRHVQKMNTKHISGICPLITGEVQDNLAGCLL